MNIFRIALIHFIETERTLLAKMLSCVSGYEFVINRDIYEWKRLYHIDDSRVNSFENQFLLLTSSFIERVKSETDQSAFISNGAVFSEALTLKLKINEKKIECYQPEEIEMIESLLNIAGRYAAHHYDQVIHIQSSDTTSFNEMSVAFYEKYHVAYKIFDGNSKLNDIFENIIQKIEIPRVQPLENAIYEAVRLVTFKN